MASSSKSSATSVSNMTIKHQIFGKFKMKEITTEITTGITENLYSMASSTTVEKKATQQFIVGKIRKRNKMTLSNVLWEPHYVEKYQKIINNNTLKNGWDTVEHNQ